MSDICKYNSCIDEFDKKGAKPCGDWRGEIYPESLPLMHKLRHVCSELYHLEEKKLKISKRNCNNARFRYYDLQPMSMLGHWDRLVTEHHLS